MKRYLTKNFVLANQGISMDIEYTTEQEMIANSAKEIAEDFGPEYWREKDSEGEFPQEFWDALAQAGFQGIAIPEEYDGGGMGMREMAVAMEKLGANGCGMGGMWLLVLTSVFGAFGIIEHGSEELKEKYLPKIAKGDIEFCMALTEPNAGTNTLNIDAKAEKDGDEYVINGSKTFISGVDRADAMLLITRTTPLEEAEKKTQGITEFVIDLPRDGIDYNPIAKHGFNYSKTCEVSVNDVRVSEDAILGEKDKGWYQLLDTLNPERMSFSAGLVGAGELASDLAVDYSKDREIFDVPIGTHQGLQFPLAEAYSKLQSAKILNEKAAKLFDEDAPYYKIGKATNMAKVAAVKAAEETVYNAMQVFGGYGYTEEYDLERLWREVNLVRLAPVTQQMGLAFVGERVLEMPKSY